MLVGYGRVSMHDQNPELQVAALKEAGCQEIFIDVISRKMKMKERPRLKQCLDYLKRGDVLVVWKLDRFTGSLHQLINNMVELSERGIYFRSLTQGFDTSTVYGRMMMNIVAVFAEFEREQILERTRAGLENARLKGISLGRPPIEKKRKDEAIRLYRDGLLTVGMICTQTGLDRTTFYRALRKYPELMKRRLELRMGTELPDRGVS